MVMSEKSRVVRSTSNDEKEILSGIMELHNQGKPFDLDTCYSRGNTWKELPEPRLRFDIAPVEGTNTVQADSKSLPLESDSIRSIYFDPPFMFGTHGQTKNNIMNKRFTMFDSWEDLHEMYCRSLMEFYRVLSRKGILVFKCQDYTDSKTTLTHCLVWKWATEMGFYAKDIFIFINNLRIYNPNLTQRHARKTHSYFLVLSKT